jgi:hypothetical protein
MVPIDQNTVGFVSSNQLITIMNTIQCIRFLFKGHSFPNKLNLDTAWKNQIDESYTEKPFVYLSCQMTPII